jgi:hypothetical protein
MQAGMNFPQFAHAADEAARSKSRGATEPGWTSSRATAAERRFQRRAVLNDSRGKGIEGYLICRRACVPRIAQLDGMNVLVVLSGIDDEDSAPDVPFALRGNECGSQLPLACAGLWVSRRIPNEKGFRLRKPGLDSRLNACESLDALLVEPHVESGSLASGNQRLNVCGVCVAIADEDIEHESPLTFPAARQRRLKSPPSVLLC